MSGIDEDRYNRHGGRNAFRNTDDDDTTPSQRAATLRAMRSFTESIDCDVPPVPELPPELDIDRVEGLKSSDTNDTIIEVGRKSHDFTLGETQKYKMTVPGPGHTDAEQDMHKSLIRDEEDDLDREVEHAMATVPTVKTAKRSRQEEDDDQTALRREYNAAALQRRRPTTPTSACVVESFAFVGAEDAPKEANVDKMKVSIPSSRRRKGDMYEFYESMGSQMPYRARRGSISGRTTPLNDYEGDILEENPQFKDRAPPKPVVNRRISLEWENFEEQKDKTEMDQPPPKPQRAPQNTHVDDDEQPTFSEDMKEERDKLRRERLAKKNSPPTDKTDAIVPQRSVERPPKPTSPPKLVGSRQSTFDKAPSLKSRQSTMEKEPFVKSKSSTVDKNLSAVAAGDETIASVEEETVEEYTYDPNDYPGYIWNYEKQEWEVDPNYDPVAHAQQQAYDQQAGDQQYDYQGYSDQYTQEYGQQAYDQQQYDEGTYDQQAYDQQQFGGEQYTQQTYDQYHAGYDQGTEAQAPNEYSYTTSAYHSGYDQTEQQNYYGNTEYDYTTAAYHAGYDQGAEQTTICDYDDQNQQEGYDYTTTGYGQNNDQNYAGYDQKYQDVANQGQKYQYGEAGTYDTNGYDYSQYPGYGQSEQAYPAEGTTEQDQSAAQAYVPPTPEEIPRPSIPVAAAVPMFVSAPAQKDPYAWDGETHQEVPTAAASASPLPAQSSPARPPAPPRPVGPVEHQTEETAAAAAAAPPRPPPAARPPPPRPSAPAAKPAPPPAPAPEEEDPWARFKAMTEKVNKDMAQTSELMKNLEDSTAAKDIKDESYLSNIGGEQGYIDSVAQREIARKAEEAKEVKQLKKKLKQSGKKAVSPTFDPDEEDSMDKAAQELAAKLAAKMDMENWKPTLKQTENVKREDSMSAIPPRKRSSLKDSQQDSGGSLELPAHLNNQQRDSITPKGDLDPSDPVLAAPAWADFDTAEPVLPPSESGFFSKKAGGSASEAIADPFATTSGDPFAPPDKALIEENYDPFAVQSADDIMAAAKAKAEEAKQRLEGKEDVDFFDAGRQSPDSSSPTPEGGSPVSHRPQGFEDDFKCEAGDGETPTPLYDEDDSMPLPDFLPKFAGDGWQLMIRHPIKKKSFMAERCWKPCFVRLRDHTLYVFNNREDPRPIQELLLQATYSLSDTTLQAYDIYGKIHTVKLQYVIYKEKVGIRPGQITRLVEGHITKYGLPLEHSAQCNVLLKFGSLDAPELQSFVTTVEDILFQCPTKRDTKPIYKQDEVQVHCYDEYSAYVDKDGILSDQKARVRMFCLAFVTGSPFLEIGLNDRRRQGKEIVRRKDILPMYTERWIRFENLEFHSTVDRSAFETEQVIRLSPPDGCFFEIMRFRVRPPRNREKALNVKCIMKIAGSKVEIRMEVMAASELEKNRGGKQTRRQIPCEDIAVRFPIPEAWIYIFREERHWGVGSVHSKKLRPGKVKNLKDRLLGAVQSNEPNLIEVAIGEAKYEHVYRSLVWRIPRLPEKHHAAYKSHLLKCRFELSSFDLMPETFLPRCDVDFTMPLATVSNTVVRSVSVEQHEDSDRVEKFVRYVAKCQYKVEIDYVQCADLDVDTADPSVNPEAAIQGVPELHQPAFHPDNVQDLNEGYRIDFPERVASANDSSSDDEDDKQHKMPIIQIDMKNYGY